ncbi:MAG TPA: lysylphosphatidylglycerol synthase transmembrane domain-containing protein [Polyangia bacterium]|nr:lysylphosphatidylglycerol synthase transmembrane domain-containing protein [Polyangia bacterium]
MSTPRRRVAVALARGLVGVAAVAFVAHHLSWHEVWGALRRARVALLVAVVAINGLMLTVRAARLQVLLSPARASLASLLRAVVASSALNNVFPLRAGDVARLYMLESCAGIGKSAAMAIAVVEKLLEVVVLAALALVATCFAPNQSWVLGTGAAALGVAIASLVVLRRMADGRRGRLPGFLRSAAARIAPGMAVLRSSEATAETLGASLAAWSCEIAMIILCARAIDLHVPLVLAVVVLLGINLAMAVPALPANAGTFESAAAVVLVFARVAKPTAVAFALLYHLVQVVPVTLAGLGLLAGRGLRFGPYETPEAPTSTG